MTDSDKIFDAVNGLRQEVREEFSARRKHVDEEFRRVHERIDGMEDAIKPLTMADYSQRQLAKVGAWVVGVLIAIGTLAIAVLKYLNGG